INITLQAEYDLIDLPGEYGNSELLLISPKIEINFTTRSSWTTFLQYNTQQNNFNINSRFQYRFKPMSDLYLVYTDNYFTTPLLQNKNRAIVFKLNYWLNM
ncbi:MAG TPA: hydrolase, partial [Panacibacter sp.]|nr:hydrolase [Panacibacter sp.]